MKKILTLLMLCLSILSIAQDKNSTRTTVFKASITCEKCEAKIMKQLPYEKGVKSVEVDVKNKLVTIAYKSSKSSDESLKTALEKLGYDTLVMGEAKTLSVKGNCDMCKARIEKAALKSKGVEMANWNKETQALTVLLDVSTNNIEDLHLAIAKAGHDTNQAKADNMSYAALPDCCKYKR